MEQSQHGGAASGVPPSLKSLRDAGWAAQRAGSDLPPPTFPGSGNREEANVKRAESSACLLCGLLEPAWPFLSSPVVRPKGFPPASSPVAVSAGSLLARPLYRSTGMEGLLSQGEALPVIINQTPLHGNSGGGKRSHSQKSGDHIISKGAAEGSSHACLSPGYAP